MSAHVKSELHHRKNKDAQEKIVDKGLKQDFESVSHQNALEHLIENTFQSYSPRFRTFVLRAILSMIMLITLPILVFGDFLITFAIILTIITQCYREYIRVGYVEYRVHGLPLIRSLAYYILFTDIYFLLAEFPITYLSMVIPEDFYTVLITYHNFISFCMFMLGVVVFVLTLKTHFYKMQFSLYGWCIIGSTFLNCCGLCLFKNFQNGIMWVILPMSLIVMNDIFAYLFGSAFGRTPLIKLSPKKTWEGFIGAGIVTLLGSVILVHLMTKFPFFYCSYKFAYGQHTLNVTCATPTFMQPRVFQFPALATIILPERISSFEYIPVYLHMLVIGAFCSILAPFGGFFASGFKRAFKIKDFGHAFPGHGGMIDRMDCQFLLPIFVYVYTNAFVGFNQPQSIVKKILELPHKDQLEIYKTLTESLIHNGLLPV